MMYGGTSFHADAVSWLTFTAFPKPFAFTNVLIFFGLLKGVTMLMPDNAFRLAFTNGLMSESMIIWFAIILIFEIRRDRKVQKHK